MTCAHVWTRWMPMHGIRYRFCTCPGCWAQEQLPPETDERK